MSDKHAFLVIVGGLLSAAVGGVLFFIPIGFLQHVLILGHWSDYPNNRELTGHAHRILEFENRSLDPLLSGWR
jgi:hypothetical protein